MKARIYVTLKQGVLDPQGSAVARALGNLGFSGVKDVRQGKYIEIALTEKNKKKATEAVESMCKKLLANTVIESYRFELEAS